MLEGQSSQDKVSPVELKTIHDQELETREPGKENRAVCDNRRKQKMIQKYREERALDDALWSNEKSKERLGGDPWRLYARGMLETILSTPNLLRNTTLLAVDMDRGMMSPLQERAVRMQGTGTA